MNCPTSNAGVRIQSRAPECHAQLLVPHLLLDATQAIPRDPSDVGEMASLSPSKRGVLGLPLLSAQACASVPLPLSKTQGSSSAGRTCSREERGWGRGRAASCGCHDGEALLASGGRGRWH